MRNATDVCQYNTPIDTQKKTFKKFKPIDCLNEK